MEWILISLLIFWLVSPILLLILWLHERSVRKHRESILKQLAVSGRISPQELMQNGIAMPQVPPQYTAPAVPPAPPAMQPNAPLTVQNTQFVPPNAQFVPPTYNAAPVQMPRTPEQPAEAAPVLPAAPAAETPAPAAVPVQPASVPTPAPAPGYAPAAAGTYPAQAAPKEELKISAITVMLGVGVVLIVIAGLLFARSQWSSLGDFGRLTTLAAGSVLFFGASALARRVFQLERTGMAFFVIGSAFLPISVWAAGYFGLLGEGLSGASNNLLIMLAFLAFTAIALIAVRMYRQTGWGIAFLCGLTLSYLYFARAILATDLFENDFQSAVFLLFSSGWALLLAYLSRPLKEHLPLPIAVALEPFALGFAFINALEMLAAFSADDSLTLCGAAVMLAAAVFFAPAVTDRIRSFSALPVGALALLGFGLLFHPLHGVHSWSAERADDPTYLFYGSAYAALLLIVCALLYLILLLTNSLPDSTKKGYQIGAYVWLFAALLPLLWCETNLPLVILTAVMLAVTAFSALRGKDILLRGLTAAQAWVLSLVIVKMMPSEWSETAHWLLFAGLLAGCYVLFVLIRRLRTVFSDFLFPISVTVLSAGAMMCSEFGETWQATSASVRWQFLGAGALLLATVLLYWLLATAHDTAKPPQYAYAVLLSVSLLLCAVAANVPGVLRTSLIALLWSAVSYCIALLAYFTTKKRFHGVRRLLFGLNAVPPLLLAVFAELFVLDIWSEHGGWGIALLLLGTAMMMLLWRLFANRGFRTLSVTGFAATLILLLESTFFSVHYAIFNGFSLSSHPFSFTVWMLTALWIAVLSIVSMLIAKRILTFVGCDAVTAVMQAAAPLTVLLLSVFLLVLEPIAWKALFPVFTVGLCVLAWCTTRRTQVILPGVSALALILTLEAVRQHLPWGEYSETAANVAIGVLLLCFAGMTVLFPYLGIVARESITEPAEKRRSYVLTAMGGAIPVWLMLLAMDGSHHTAAQEEWMRFFVWVLAAGYLLHFAFSAKTPEGKKGMVTAASACLLLACWLQPLFEVDGTYWDGKLHLLPLIAFGAVLRYLYGKQLGGGFLFCIGVYTMLRLSIAAMLNETTADLLTVLLSALAIFIVSFYIKQKKWFLLGGISLVGISLYLCSKFDVQWWIYLLLTGMLLIVIAGANETLKKQGESLKEKAGRLWEDWTW